MANNRQVEQIKIFHVKDYKTERGMERYNPKNEVLPSLEDDVNNFIIKGYKEGGNWFKVETNVKFITVKYQKPVNLDEK